MKELLKTKTILASGALALTLALAPAANAAEASKEVTANADKKVEETKQDRTAEKRRKIMEEATVAIRETQNALKALDEKKTQDALAALERASGKLTIILARDPKLALAPSGVGAITYDVLTSIDAVKEVRDKAEDALDDGRVQEARRLIGNLASETVISTTNIPLATYPVAIKEAARLIDDGKTEEAKAVLQTALNTLVITDVIIPLPVVTAENLLKEAETLAEKAERKEEENKRLADLLKEARTELEFAQALGYGAKDDFKNLYEQLDQIEGKTEGGKSGKGFFDKIKGFLKDTVVSSQPEQQSGQADTGNGSTSKPTSK